MLFWPLYFTNLHFALFGTSFRASITSCMLSWPVCSNNLDLPRLAPKQICLSRQTSTSKARTHISRQIIASAMHIHLLWYNFAFCHTYLSSSAQIRFPRYIFNFHDIPHPTTHKSAFRVNIAFYEINPPFTTNIRLLRHTSASYSTYPSPTIYIRLL